MIIYIFLLTFFYLFGVLADYKTTQINLANGRDEINPVLRKNTHWRLLFPFLCILPVLVFLIGVEYRNLESGQYINSRASFVYETSTLFAQIASLVVFFTLVVGSSKVVASISNTSIILYGKGLPDLVVHVIGWRSATTIFIVTTCVSLIAVIPLVYAVRYFSFKIFI